MSMYLNFQHKQCLMKLDILYAKKRQVTPGSSRLSRKFETLVTNSFFVAAALYDTYSIFIYLFIDPLSSLYLQIV